MTVMEAFRSDFALDLVQDLLDKFKSLLIDEAGQIVQFDAENELKKLERMLYKAQALLDNSDFTTNKRYQSLVGDVTRVFYDVEDLIEDMLFNATNKTSLIEKFFAYLTRGSGNRKIEELQEKLEDIISALKTSKPAKKQAIEFSPVLRYDWKDFLVNKEQFQFPEKLFGRDSDKENVIAMLLDEKVSSVSIVGIDGLGKTTLARSVLFDSRIKERFPSMVWVSVSSSFDLAKTMEFILHKNQCESSLPHVGKSMLLVLDDLWDVKYNDRSSFKSLFMRPFGCKVLLTTSNPHVTLVTESTPYRLQLMKDDDCCALIMDRALSSNNLSGRERATLVGIASTMAQKCKGLPLAANILGLLLRSMKNDVQRMVLSDTDVCELKEYKEEIFPVFRLNNPNLASHLKKCFAYCSLFPHEYDFKKEKLVQMWMAEGFVLAQGMTSLEEMGRDYFDELLHRSIFQLSNIGDNEKPTYKIHEFIHKFAQFVASDTCFRLEEGKVFDNNLLKARHVSFLCNSIELLCLKSIEKCESLRTFLLLSEHGTQIGQVPYSLFQKLVRLRVLDLSRSDINELPGSLCRLKHLRYLDASHTNILRLPNTTSYLHRLQVLKLRNCYKLLELPKDLKNLTNLQHLDVDIKKLRGMPGSIGSLTCLKTLPAFIVGKKEGYQITELKNLRLLCGSICVSDLQNVKDGAQAREAMICEKPFIQSLELEWRNCSSDGLLAMDVLANIQPHNFLKELKITNYGGTNFPAWLSSTSCMLVSIHIQKSRQLDTLPSFGLLPFLKHLHLEAMDHVMNVDDFYSRESTTGAFPSLETLKFQDMPRLLIWYGLPDSSMPKLREFTIEDCPILLMRSLIPMISLQTLEINRCPELISLPELPTSIQSLIIIESDIVKQRYEPENGPGWNIIKEIPYVEIDYEIVRPASSS